MLYNDNLINAILAAKKMSYSRHLARDRIIVELKASGYLQCKDDYELLLAKAARQFYRGIDDIEIQQSR